MDELFSRNDYGTPSTTMLGEHVKSNAEKRIADYFTQNGIRYEYEKGAKTNALIFKKTFAHPDFYLYDFDIFVEYWGLVNTSKNYKRTMKWKMAQYHENGIKFISLYPQNMSNLDWVFRAKFREVVGFDLRVAPKAPSGANLVSSKFCSNCGAPTRLGGSFCGYCGKSVLE